MKSSNQEIIINHEAKNLYKIVLKVEDYPQFIPWCSSVNIKSQNKDQILADMIVLYKYFLPQTFTSLVKFNSKKLIISTKYIEGPLKDLKTKWLFEPLNSKKTKIYFNVEFKFEKFIYQKVAELFFPLIERNMIDSFIKRADDIHNN